MMIIILHYMNTEQNTLTGSVKEPIKRTLMCKTSVRRYAEQSSRANHAIRFSWLKLTQLNVHQKKRSVYAIIDDKAAGHLLDQKSSICLVYILILWHTLCHRVAEQWHLLGDVLLSSPQNRAIQIQSMIECDDIPNCRNEITTPDVVPAHPHVADLASQLPDLK